MKNPVPDRLKKLVIDAARRHSINMGVSEYIGDINYMKENKEAGDDKDCLAEIIVNRRYLRFILSIYPCFIEEWGKKGNSMIEDTIAHEIAHLATQHMYECCEDRHVETTEVMDAWETLTEKMSRLSVRIDKFEKKRWKIRHS